MSIAELKKDIKNNVWRNFYFFYGPECYLIDYYLKEMMNKIDLPEFNVVRFSEKASNSDLVSELDKLPILFNKRLIISRKIIDNPPLIPDCTTLIFISETHTDIPKYIQAIIDNNNGLGVPFKNPTSAALKKWIINYCESKNKQISVEDAEFIIQICGHFMYFIKSEVDKIIAYTGNNDVCERSIIEKIITENDEFKIFELSNSILNKNLEGIIKFIVSLSDNTESYQPILAFLYSFVYDLFVVKTVVTENKSLETSDVDLIKQYFKPNRYFLIFKYLKLAQNIELSTIRQLMERCIDIESKARNNSIDTNVLLQNFCLSWIPIIA